LNLLQLFSKKAQKISKYFRKSSKAAQVLIEEQKSLNLKVKKLKIDNVTRWNSAYLMIKRLTASREAIERALVSNATLKTKKQRPNNLAADEWLNLNLMLKILWPLFQITKWLSLEQVPTIGLLLPALFKLLYRVDASEDQEFPIMCQLLKRTILFEVQTRTMTLTNNLGRELMVALILDPRTKDLWFISDPEIRNQYYFCAMEYIVNEVEQLQPQSGSFNNQKLDKISPMQEVFGVESISQRSLSAQEELFAYTAEKKLEIGFIQNGKFILNNPLNWWAMKQSLYPKIAEIARKFLCFPVSSLQSERVFSKAGWIVSKRRSSLGDDNVCNLVFVAVNNPHIEE